MNVIYSYRLRRAIVALTVLSLLLVGPHGVVIAPALAANGGEGVNDCNNSPSGCSGCDADCPDEGSAADGAPAPSRSARPVDFRLGSAVESAVDIEIPCPGFTWSHRRSYDSRMSRNINTSGSFVDMEGVRWMGGATNPYFRNLTSTSIDLYLNASSKRTFSDVGMTGVFRAPDSPLVIVKSGSLGNEVFTCTNTESGRVSIYYGLNASITGNLQGRLKERTTRAFMAFSPPKPGAVYTYNADGTVDTVTLPQNWLVKYEYFLSGFNIGRLQYVSAYAGPYTSNTLIQRAEYTYFDSSIHSAELGQAGDLIQVKVSRRASGDSGSALSIVRTTQYRYFKYDQNIPEDLPHQIKFVFEPDAVQRAIDYNSSDSIAAPGDLLTRADNATIVSASGTKELRDFANRKFTYYYTDSATPPSTLWGTETLTRYGGSGSIWNWDPFWHGAVKTESIGGDCNTCNQNVANVKVTKNYYYLELVNWYAGEGSTDPKQTVRIVIEDTIDSSGTARYRRLYGVNYFGTAIREAFITDPINPSASNIWCTSLVLNSDMRVVQRRMPTAHKGLVINDATLKKFLNPTDGTPANQNDADTVNSGSGVVYHYEYGVGKRPTGELVSAGTGGTKYYIAATDYGNGDTDSEGQDLAEGKLPIARYTYPEKKTIAERSQGVKTQFSYTFWDAADTSIKTITTTLAKVAAGQNGAGNGGGDPATTNTQFFDRLGRVRWTQDGEGYINYYSYHPALGIRAFTAVDTNPASAPPGATGNPTKWLTWDDDGDGNATYDSAAKPSARDSLLPTALNLVTKHELDEQGRERSTIDPSGATHYTAYQHNRMLRFPYWDATNSWPLLPIEVIEVNNADRTTATYGVDPGMSALTGGLPTGLSGSTNQTHYIHWVRHFYDKVNGQLIKILRYHNAPDTGDGDGTDPIGKNYYLTAYEYDSLGRRKTEINTASLTRHQVTQWEYDLLDREIRVKRAAGNSGVNTGANATLGTLSLPTLAIMSETVYDAGVVGDSHVTQVKQINTVDGSANSVKHSLTNFYRTFRGHTRGIKRQHFDGTSTTDVTPYLAMDVDWLGRTTASAQFTSAPPWSTLEAGYDAWVHTDSGATGRHSRQISAFDVLGRFYRTESYPGTSTAALQTNNYYDRNGRLVSTGDKYGVHSEYAYDGAGRQYQVRTAIDVRSPAYSGGKFQYRSPAPHPVLATMADGAPGEKGVIQLEHKIYNSSSKVTEEHTFELNHNNTVGLEIDSSSNHVRHSVHSWYNGADQLTTTADYGAGNISSTDNAWKYTDAPSYDAAPSASDPKKLVTKYGYDAGGRLEMITDPAGVKTKTILDEMDRRVFAVENYVDLLLNTSGNPTNVGGGTNNDQDRVTRWDYDGFQNVILLRAYNGSSSSVQETKYFYLDSYNASLVTNTIYPDSLETTPVSQTAAPTFDQVRIVYDFDGKPSTMTDQRGVIRTLTYDTARRLARDGATTIPSSVYGGSSEANAVRAIGRTYTSLGEPELITSYQNANGSGTIQNEVKYSYDTYRNISQIEQSHQLAVTAGTPKVSFTYDANAASNIFLNGLHCTHTYYPEVTNAVLVKWYGGVDSFSDRLHRSVYEKLWGGNLNSNVARTFFYEYNGVNRLAGISDDGSPSFSPNLRRLMYATAGNYDRYDRFGRTMKQKWTTFNGATTHDEFNYDYDYAGNRKWREDVRAAANSKDFDEYYNYDGLHRLKDFARGNLTGSPYNGIATSPTPGREQTWALDQLGNWSTFSNKTAGSTDLSQTRYHNAVNEIDGNGGSSITGTPNWADPVYDTAGNATTIPQPASPTSTFILKYDPWNRLVAGWVPGGEASATSYEYDGLGQRNQKVVPTGTHAGTYDYYYNDQWQLLTEVKNGTDKSIYHWHPFYIDALATRMRASDMHFFLHDANFNVTAAVSDSTDAVVERYNYTPYGEVKFLTNVFVDDSDQISDIGNQHLYTGRERDAESGLQLNRNRYYASNLGRWLARDPIEYHGSWFNLYEYNDSKPISRTDAHGLQPDVVWPGPGGGIRPTPPPMPGPDWAPGDGWSPGPGWNWRDIPGAPGGGVWEKPGSGSIHPDPGRGNEPQHLDWNDPLGNRWKFFPPTGKWSPGNRNNPNKPRPMFPPGTLEGAGIVAGGLTIGGLIMYWVCSGAPLLTPIPDPY